MSANAHKVFSPSPAESANHQTLLVAADDAKRTGMPITSIGDFVTSWPSRISKGELEGFEPPGTWVARGKGRRQVDGVWRTSSITLVYAGPPDQWSARPSKYAGVIAALELLTDEFRTLGGEA